MRIAELTPVYKRTNQPSWALQRLTSSKDIFDFCSCVVYNDVQGVSYCEKCFAIYLNSNLRVVAFEKQSEGGISDTIVDVRKVFQGALLCNATHVVLVHNHPSGNLRPSKSDDVLTEAVNKAAKVLNIKFLDHVIVTEDDYYSYNDERGI